MSKNYNIVAAVELKDADADSSNVYVVSLTPRLADGQNPCIFADGEEVGVMPAKSKSLMIVEAPFSLVFYDAHYIVESR